jgi:hypothetical protein
VVMLHCSVRSAGILFDVVQTPLLRSGHLGSYYPGAAVRVPVRADPPAHASSSVPNVFVRRTSRTASLSAGITGTRCRTLGVGPVIGCHRCAGAGTPWTASEASPRARAHRPQAP